MEAIGVSELPDIVPTLEAAEPLATAA